MNASDFKRPDGVEEGVLLNSNNESLKAYKKAKRRMNTVTELEEKVKSLEGKYDKLIKILGIVENE